MGSVNKVTLLGNLGMDPEIKTGENGKTLAKFTIATTDTYKNDKGERIDKTEWHNIIFWGTICNVIDKYLKKGMQTYIEGKITSRPYQDKDGITKYFTEIVGTNLVLLGSKPQVHKSDDTDTLNDLPF